MVSQKVDFVYRRSTGAIILGVHKKQMFSNAQNVIDSYHRDIINNGTSCSEGVIARIRTG